MNVSGNFWSPILRELVLNEDGHQASKSLLISSDKNTFDFPDPKNVTWKKIKKLFPDSSDWIINSQTNKYHISVYLSDFFDCNLSKEKLELMKNFLPFIPKKIGEELIRQNFINIPNHIIDNWPIKGDPIGDLLEQENKDWLIPTTHFDIRGLFLTTFIYKMPFNDIKSNDIRIYFNFLEKAAHRGYRLLDWECINLALRIYKHFGIDNCRSLPPIFYSRFLFSGAFSYSYSSKDNINFLMRDDFKNKIFDYIKIREEVFQMFLPQISILNRNKLDQQYKITQFPVEISNLVIEYTQYLDLKNFYKDSTPEELELFVSKCTSWLEIAEQMDKATHFPVGIIHLIVSYAQNPELEVEITLQDSEIKSPLYDLSYLDDPDLSIC